MLGRQSWRAVNDEGVRWCQAAGSAAASVDCLDARARASSGQPRASIEAVVNRTRRTHCQVAASSAEDGAGVVACGEDRSVDGQMLMEMMMLCDFGEWGASWSQHLGQLDEFY